MDVQTVEHDLTYCRASGDPRHGQVGFFYEPDQVPFLRSFRNTRSGSVLTGLIPPRGNQFKFFQK